MGKRRWLLLIIAVVCMLTACENRKSTEESTWEGQENLPEPTKEPVPTSDLEVSADSSRAEPQPVSQANLSERSYDSFRDFPYENMDFIDEETFTFFKEVYGNIDFYGEFEMGDLTLYDAYIKAYKKLVCNEIPFIAPETGEEHYIEEYIDPAVYGGQIFDPHEFVYYLVDMDGDDTPELCVWKYSTYIFKYDASHGKMILWDTIDSSWERIHGTGELCWNWEGTRHTLCRLDENGEIIFGVYFMEEATWSNGKETFMVTVPFYADENKKIEITQEMKDQAYYSEEEDLYFFNVTEEQYHELTEDFFEAHDISEEKLKTIGYTYDELFGNGTLCETCNSNKALYLIGR